MTVWLLFNTIVLMEILERRTTENSSSRRIMHLVPVFALETNSETNNECLPKFVQTDNASSSVKTNHSLTRRNSKGRWIVKG